MDAHRGAPNRGCGLHCFGCLHKKSLHIPLKQRRQVARRRRAVGAAIALRGRFLRTRRSEKPLFIGFPDKAVVEKSGKIPANHSLTCHYLPLHQRHLPRILRRLATKSVNFPHLSTIFLNPCLTQGNILTSVQCIFTPIGFFVPLQKNKDKR